MTVSFVGSASAEATSLTLPAHQAGDLLIVAAATNAASEIALPSGWLALHLRADTGRSFTVGYKIAATSAETSGTWTNAVLVACAVYRHSTNYITIGGMRFSGNSAGTNISYGPLTRNGGTAGIMTPNQWVIAAGMCGANNLTAELPPTGFTNRVSIAGTSVCELAMHDSAADRGEITGVISLPLGGTGATMTVVASIENTGIAKTAAAGGILIHPGMSGGMRG